MSGNTSVGGLVGKNDEECTVSNSYWDEDSTGQSDGVGLNEGDFDAEGLSTSEMQGDSAEQNMDALDFENTWKTKDGDYPSLTFKDEDGETSSDGEDEEGGEGQSSGMEEEEF